MKTLKSIAMGLILLLSFGAAKAADKTDKLTKNYALNTYIDAISHGKLQGFSDILDTDVKFSMMRGTQMVKYTKDEMMEFMKGIQNVEQACTISTSDVENNDNLCVVKVNMKYKDFVRSNYVTMANTGKGWKITNVYSVFK